MSGHTPYNTIVRTVEEVRQQLQRYQHPLFEFDAQEGWGGNPEVRIRLRHPIDGVDEYRLPLHPRDIAGSQFPWSLQRMLYAGLYDYIADMFIRTPQSRDQSPPDSRPRT